MAVILAILLCFVLFALCSSISVADQTQMKAMLEKVAGVYTDPAKTKGLEKTVLITACNFGFVNHLHNFKCFADRLGMKFLVMAMDAQAYDYITKNTTMDSYLMLGGAVGEVTGSATDFRTKQFNLITAKKKEAVHDILQLGFDVLFSDTDVAMIRDPLPYMVRINVDYAHSLNYMCKVGETWDFHKSKIEGNTGFYFVRSNNNTIKLWADAFAAAPKYPRLDDQAIFWKVIRTSKKPLVLPIGKCRNFNSADDMASLFRHQGHDHTKYLVSCVLDTCMFSSGMISNVYEPELTYDMLQTNLKKLNESIVTLHANYLSGNKKKMNRMKDYGFWLATTDADGVYQSKCLDYVPHVPTLLPSP